MNDISSITRREVISNLFKIAIFSFTTFFTLKLLMQQLDPTNKRKRSLAEKAKQMLTKLGIKTTETLSDYELMIASHLLDPSDIKISWQKIGGLKPVIQEIIATVIVPIKKKELLTDSLLTQPPKGILLHGPPGCGKTMIAKATAREAGCRFINLDLSILTDKWYGESQKLASAVFSLAIKIQPCIIFIDEIDSFLRSRTSRDHEATAMMKAQFMTLWDGICTDPTITVIVMGATNRPNDLDKAILRRMPAAFYISLPDESQRKEILNLILAGEPKDATLTPTSLAGIAKLCEGFSGSDIFELCRNASMYRVKDFMTTNYKILDGGIVEKTTHPLSEDQEQCTNSLRPITLDDLQRSFKKMVTMKVANTSLTE